MAWYFAGQQHAHIIYGNMTFEIIPQDCCLTAPCFRLDLCMGAELSLLYRFSPFERFTMTHIYKTSVRFLELFESHIAALSKRLG